MDKVLCVYSGNMEDPLKHKIEDVAYIRLFPVLDINGNFKDAVGQQTLYHEIRDWLEYHHSGAFSDVI